MSRSLAFFLVGTLAGSIVTGGALVAAGDPYEYATLRDYPCEQIKAGTMPTPATVVPGQDNPCFVRYFRYDRWLP